MQRGLRIAVIGSGISGLSAAWLLSKSHDVVLIEEDARAGGHSNTVDAPSKAGRVAVDTGFIVYNVESYPNLVALFSHLDVETAPASMSFAVSLDRGRYEYSGNGVAGLFGQPSNIFSPSHVRMVADLLRFFREAPRLLERTDATDLSLGQYLGDAGYSQAFVTRHILPMAAAIWSTPSASVMAFPARAFVRFFQNHGLLQVADRPQWRTVVGGSRAYLARMLEPLAGRLRLASGARCIIRHGSGVDVVTGNGRETFDHCVLATHADTALALLGADAAADERNLLGPFRYIANRAILHRDPAHMPRRRRLWSSWNYLGGTTETGGDLSVTYWMNNLQPLGPGAGDLFVTLNPVQKIAPDRTISAFDYSHPMFDGATERAQRSLWALQGVRRTWFCGSYFGFGFHEDGLQSGLAVAEALGGVRRPWTVKGQSSRIHLPPLEVPRIVSPREAVA
jgi:predicted NAD/FAD-binding protein